MIRKLLHQLFQTPTPTPKRAVIIPKQVPPMSNLETIQTTKWKVWAIKAEINRLANEIKQLKTRIRQPNYMISWREAEELACLKQQVTKLCVLQAARRNKSHIAKQDLTTLVDTWLENSLDSLLDEFGLD